MKTFKHTVRPNNPLSPELVKRPLPFTKPAKVELTYPNKMFIEATITPDPLYEAMARNDGLVLCEDGARNSYEIVYWEYANNNNKRNPIRRTARWRFVPEMGLVLQIHNHHRAHGWEINATCADILAAIYQIP